MTLTDLANSARRVIAGLATLAVIYLMFILLKPAVLSGWSSIFPDKNLPNTLYGKLPPLEFVEKSLSNQNNPTYELNTKDGKLPGNLPDRMVVYPTAPTPFSYSAGRNAQTHAASLGFSDEELITDLKGDIYRWRDSETGSILQIEINSKNLSLTTNFTNKSPFYSAGSITENRAKELAIGKLRSIGRFYDTLYQNGTQKVTLARIQGNNLVPAAGVDTQMVRIDFFRNINEYPIYGPDPSQGLINVTVRIPRNDMIVLNHPLIEYAEWEIISAQGADRATYPIIPVSEAWDAVSRQGRGVIVSLSPVNSSIFTPYNPVQVDKILVNNIYLAYYDTPEKQRYIQPIYVFEGSYNRGNRAGGNITIYYPAIPGQYIESPESTQ